MELLLMMFIALTVAGGLGIAFLFLAKNPKVQNGLFYFVAVLGMLIAVIAATGYPSNYIIRIVIGWAWGFLAIIAIIVKTKNPEKINLAKWIVSASVVGGLIQLFFF